MASYYYLMSSLPMLKADEAMPFSYASFLEMCRTSVSSAEMERLETLKVSSNQGPLIAEWAEFYSALANELVYQRSQRLGRPCEVPVVRDEKTTSAVTAALNAKNPLEAEKLLLALEFDQLDALMSLHFFDAYALNGYALKLRLMERLTVFDKAGGKAEFKRLLDHVQQQILSI